jgi:hypothetical protein
MKVLLKPNNPMYEIVIMDDTKMDAIPTCDGLYKCATISQKIKPKRAIVPVENII